MDVLLFLEALLSGFHAAFSVECGSLDQTQNNFC